MRSLSKFQVVPSNRSTLDSGSLRKANSGAASTTLGTESADLGGWFAPACFSILGSVDPGAILAKLTGSPESSCRFYVAKIGQRREPKVDFLRVLFANEQYGAQFFEAFMAYNRAQWWLEFQRNADIGSRVLELTKSD